MTNVMGPYNSLSDQSNVIWYFYSQIEEDLSTLQKKYTNLENEFDKVNEQFQEGTVKLEASEKRVTEVSILFLPYTEQSILV